MDELAGELGLDPLELRLRNLYRSGSVTPTGQMLEGEVSINEVLQRAAAAVGWKERRAAIEAANRDRRDGRRAGLGVACSYRGVSLGAEGTDAAGAIVSVQSDGSVLVSCGLTDMGQGVSSALSLIAAEVLGIDPKRVKFFPVHTGRVPDSGPTVASRSTIMGGQAAMKAAASVRDVLFEIVGGELGVAPEMLEARGSWIQVREPGAIVRGPSAAGDGAPIPGIAFDQAVALAYARGRPLLGFGWHKSEPTSWDDHNGAGRAYFTYVYSANIAELEVDIETGRVEVRKYTASHELGRAISPAMVRSQVCGGIAMGIGYGMLEDYRLRRGVPVQQNLDEYLLPTSLDMPEVEMILVEHPDPLGPFGAKSIGEPATEIAAPALLNAIAHACGRRIRELPAGLERVFLGEELRP
jgi:CO/xanthine dehydrogenase Mo-binding subunit